MTADLEAWLEEAKVRGLLGPEPLRRTISHARELGAIAVASGADPDSCLDLGSGAGVPGLVLALDWPSSRWTLLDSNLRSVAFLAEAVGDLGLGDRVAVVCQRAEEAGRTPAHREQYSLAVARAVAPAPVVAEYLAPLLAADGIAVVSEPPGAPNRWEEEGLATLGLQLVSRCTKPVAAAVLARAGDVPPRFPRRTGVAAKRPLW